MKESEQKVTEVVSLVKNGRESTKRINSFGAKFQTTFVVCFFILTNCRLEKLYKIICKVERLNIKQRRSR